MKKITILFFGLACFQTIYAQNEKEGDVRFSKCENFGVSKPLTELAKEQPAVFNPEKRTGLNKRFAKAKNNNDALPQGIDPAIQDYQGTRLLSAPIVNFPGEAGGFPPDPSGAAGPNHYVQAVNTSYKVFKKNAQKLTDAISLKSLWPGSSDDGDPIVLYDKHADRWFISQFQTNGNKILIAISTSPDPKGTYYLYTFVPDASDFPDYPKFSIWADGYYMTSNSSKQKVVVFDRERMLAGDSGAGMIVKNFSSIPQDGFFCPLSADADGQLPPYGTPCYIFSFEDDGWGGSATTDQIRIYKMTTDWNTPSNTSLVLDSKLPTESFDAVFTQSWDDISQKGTNDKLDAIAGVFNYRAQYRIWTGYNTILLCNSVNVDGNGHCGIRWYELRQDNSTKEWSIYQQSTYAPDDQSRWLGSMAMDDNRNIGIAYSVSGSNTFPGIRYSGRLAGDELGVFTFEEKQARAGNSPQLGFNRFGDYSQMSLDPDGVTLWYTGEYIESGGPRTRIFSFQLKDILSSVLSIDPEYDLSVIQRGNSLEIKMSSLPYEEKVVVDLFDISGRLINGQVLVPNSESITCKIDVSNLNKGAYLVRVGNAKFQKVNKIIIK